MAALLDSSKAKRPASLGKRDAIKGSCRVGVERVVLQHWMRVEGKVGCVRVMLSDVGDEVRVYMAELVWENVMISWERVRSSLWERRRE